MKKVKNINIKFFQKYKKIILVNSILTVGAISGFIAYKKSDKQNFDYTKNGLERVVDSCAKYGPQGIDSLVWEETENNKEVEIFNSSLSPSNIWNIRIFRGMAESTHYRIEEENINDDSSGYSKWQEIPSNNLITVTRQNLPKSIQYDKQLNIRFGKYNKKDGTIIKENAECFEWEKCSQEEVQKFDIARERIKLIAEHWIYVKFLDTFF